ncbi:MAG: hypothetical protein J2P57_07775 [Acidimicrobiaceae bacterium]|nr:hypothetical protein [Acidimicrobiaceae bacterium]
MRRVSNAAIVIGGVTGTAFALGVLAAITGTVYWVIAIGVFVVGLVYLARR